MLDNFQFFNVIKILKIVINKGISKQCNNEKEIICSCNK